MNFLKKILGRGCSHRFGWPRLNVCGRHYQVCLACGAAYEYDWEKMRRTDRLCRDGVTHIDQVLMHPTH